MNCPNCGYSLNPGRSCKHKDKFKSFKSALNDLNNKKKSIKGMLGKFDGLRAYKCNFCGGYHLGHQPNFKAEEVRR